MTQLQNLSMGPVTVWVTNLNLSGTIMVKQPSPIHICPDLTFNMALKCSVTPIKEDAERNITMKVKKVNKAVVPTPPNLIVIQQQKILHTYLRVVCAPLSE